MLFAAFLIAFVALVRWTSITLASQGRLLFPVIAPISIFTAMGLTTIGYWLLAKRKRKLANSQRNAPVGWSIVPALLAALTLAAPFVYIRPAYRTPMILASTAQLPSDMTPTELYFEDKIRWIGYRVDTPQQRVQPGETMDVTLYWQGLKPLDKNYSAFIRLYGRDAMTVTLLDTYPGGGMWQTTLWQPGDIVADHYRLRVSDTPTNTRLMPTVLNFDVGFWNYKAQHYLNTLDASGKPTSRQQYPAASLNVSSSESSSTADMRRFDKANVRHVIVAQEGRNVTLKLDWLVTGDVAEDYTTFVQLFDTTGKQVPVSGDKPSLFAPRWWRKSDVIVGDTYTIALPADFPSGQYMLKFGLYNKAGARMPAFDAKGQPINDAAISVPVAIQ